MSNSSVSVDNQDLQTYLDSFNKEIEEGNGSMVTLTPEAVEALAGADTVAQRILRDVSEEVHEVDDDDDDGEPVAMEDEDDDDEEGTYFVDEAGNYYFQPSSSKDAVTVSSEAPEEEPEIVPKVEKKQKRTAALKTRKSPRKSVQKTRPTYGEDEPDEEADSEELDYVFVMDKNKRSNPNDDIAEHNDAEEVDDPDELAANAAADNQIYDFEESVGEPAANDVNAAEPDFPATKRLIRLKTGASLSTSNFSVVPSGSSGTVHRCAHCDYTTQKRFLLSRHMKAHSDDRPFKCSVCERGFKSNASLLNHVNTHLGNKPHACKSCESAFTTSGELVRHVRYRHTGEKPHKCTECDYSSVELSKLRRHIRCHTGERPYQCPHCTYASPDTFKLKRHMRTHTGEKPYLCDICQARFTQSNSLKAHRLIHSVGDKPVFQCSLCPTTCGRKTDLRLHVQKLHHSEEPIKCRRCGKELPDRYSYKVHVKTHEGEKCYRCEFCPYASISVRHLESHMLIHTNSKPFTCPYCVQTFRQRQLLKRHVNLYHSEDYKPPKPRAKMHSCPDCKRSFTHKGNLMRHMEQHDPESNAQRDKLKLKIGRLTRLEADGSGVTIATGKLFDDECEKVDLEEEEEEGVEDVENENYELTTEEDYEIIETVEEEEEDDEFDQKPLLIAAHPGVGAGVAKTQKKTSASHSVTEVKAVAIKNESGVKEFMSLEVGDGQEFMVVEVIQCEDDEEEEEEGDDNNYVAVGNANVIQMPVVAATPSKTELETCFGFEINEEFVDDPDTKETIQLMDIIDED